MGTLTIKVKILRCEKCFMLKKLFIEPNYPNSTVLSECSCGFSRTPIFSFTNALKNPELYTIKCFFCKKEPKHPLYCIGCRRIYCNTCKKGHNTKIETKAKHILIDAYKYDFYCAEHQDNLNTAYCLDCQIDICKICIEEKRHGKHIVLLYNKIEFNKKQIERIKKNIDISKVKLTKKINMSKVLYDQIKDNNKKKLLRDVMNPCYKNNKAILSLVYYFYLMYTEIKEKNYIIMHNLTENIKFNHQPFLLVQTTSLDERLNDFIDFLKNDFVLFKRYVSTKLKKNNIIEVSKKQNENNNDKENIKENQVNQNENNLKEEEKKEDEIINDKNIIINNDEDKKNEENNEINIENVNNKNEEININNDINNNINDDNNKDINEDNKGNNNSNNEIINDNINEDIKKDSIENDNYDNNIFNEILKDNNINNEDISNEKKRVSIFDIKAIINEKYDDEILKEDDEEIDFDIKPQIEKSKNNKKEEKNDISNFSEDYYDVTFNPGAVEKENDNINNNINEVKNLLEQGNNNNILIEQKNKEEDKVEHDNKEDEDNKIMIEEDNNNINDKNINIENEKNSEKIEFEEKINEEINIDNYKSKEKNDEEAQNNEKIIEIKQEEIYQEIKMGEIKQEEIKEGVNKTDEINKDNEIKKEIIKEEDIIKEDDKKEEIKEDKDNKNEEIKLDKDNKNEDIEKDKVIKIEKEEIKLDKDNKNEDNKEDKVINIEENKENKIIQKEEIKLDEDNKNEDIKEDNPMKTEEIKEDKIFQKEEIKPVKEFKKDIEMKNEIIIDEKTDKKQINKEEPKNTKKEEPKKGIIKKEPKKQINKEEPKKQISQNEPKKGINKINQDILNKFEIKKEPNKILSKKAITTTNLNSKKAIFENKTNKNQISSKPTFPTKKGSNILNNPKFANLAKMMGGRMSNPQALSKSSTLRNEPLNIITEKENPDQLIMNKPTMIDKKKPKKISFEERIKQFES